MNSHEKIISKILSILNGEESLVKMVFIIVPIYFILTIQTKYMQLIPKDYFIRSFAYIGISSFMFLSFWNKADKFNFFIRICLKIISLLFIVVCYLLIKTYGL